MSTSWRNSNPTLKFFVRGDEGLSVERGIGLCVTELAGHFESSVIGRLGQHDGELLAADSQRMASNRGAGMSGRGKSEKQLPQ
jgi:hypothetical protein